MPNSHGFMRKMTIAVDKCYNKWIGAFYEGPQFYSRHGGLVKFNDTTWTIYDNTNSGIPDYSINQIVIDKYGNKWIGTANSGIAVYTKDCVILNVEDDPQQTLKEKIITQNFPNPFQYTTNIEYTLPKAGNITIKIFDMQGQLLRDLFSGSIDAGKHTAVWDGRTDAGREAPNGVYVYRIQFEGQTISGKMVIIK
jgi:hypothetical protein